MLKLLVFELRRISKSIFFRIIAAISFIWPIITAAFYRLILTLDLFSDEIRFVPLNVSQNERMYFTWVVSVAFITALPTFAALFTCLHVGRDYTDGIVRNKIIAGHSRAAIYLSYMITQMCSHVVLSLIYILSAFLGLAITGIGVDTNHGEMLTRLGVAIVVFLVMTVSFTALSTVFRRRAAPVILCILIAYFSNLAASVFGLYSIPPKAVDDYIKIRNTKYELMVRDEIIDKKVVEDYEKAYGKNKLLTFGWQVFYPVYLISPFGFESDYGAAGFSSFIGNNMEYPQEIDYTISIFSKDESQFDIWYNTDVFKNIEIDPDADPDSFMLPEPSVLLYKYYMTPETFERVDTMHMSFSKLNLIYLGKSLAWIVVIGGWGYLIFRKKNLF
ncbi:MAG: ABC transporter permease subunit [Clostridiales bacterium]|nr:ABC transporter permease subunit [Clostridiales bacterium]